MPARGGAGRRARAARTQVASTEPGVHGVLTRADWLALGWTDEAVQYQVATGRWTRPFPGIVVAGTSATAFRTRARAAWVAAGPGAAVSGLAAAYLLGLADEPPAVIDLQIPASRETARRPGTRVRRVRVRRRTRPWDGVVVTDVDDTVLDLVASCAHPERARFWIERACSRRLTSPAALLAALARRQRVRHRAVIVGMCARLDEGEHTWLERWYTDAVARAHGLPVGRRQVRRRVAGRTVYSDVEIDGYGVVIELDGRLGHEDPPGRHRDMQRDNAHAAEGRITLRYGWADATSDPCSAAAQVAAVLRVRGWTGTVRPCGRRCSAGAPAAGSAAVRPGVRPVVPDVRRPPTDP